MAKAATPAPITFASELVLLKGIVQIEASVDAFRTALIAAEEKDALLLEEVGIAVHEIFDRKPGAAIPQPALQGAVAQHLGKDPTLPEYSECTEAVLKFLRRNNQDAQGSASEFLVVKGSGNGVYRRCDGGYESKKK